MEIPQEILDLAVRRALEGSRGKLVVCPFCGEAVGVAIFACNSCWLKCQEEMMPLLMDHVARTKRRRAIKKKLLGQGES